jgi:hypothetical protein
VVHAERGVTVEAVLDEGQGEMAVGEEATAVGRPAWPRRRAKQGRGVRGVMSWYSVTAAVRKSSSAWLSIRTVGGALSFLQCSSVKPDREGDMRWGLRFPWGVSGMPGSLEVNA